MKMFSNELVTKLDNTKLAKNPIQGTHWYSILANHEYVQAFSYISVDTPNRENFIVDDDDNEDNDNEQSDMVNIILNMAFIKDSIVRDLQFGAGMSKTIKGHNLGARAVSGMLKTSLNLNELK